MPLPDEPDTELGAISRDGAEVATRHLVPHSDLTYRTIVELAVSDADVYQSLFTGSLIRDCTWTRTRFSRSDLDGLRVERSTFVECDFSTCDIRSSHFSRCKFISCLFDLTLISDCEFQASALENCSFKNGIIAGSRFSNSSMVACSISPGTFIHNRLFDCTISDMKLGDCTILYVIVRNCILQRVAINVESVGAMLGLKREQLRDANLIHLGREEPVPSDVDLIELISDEYRKRRWYWGDLVLALNYGTLSTVAAFENYLSRSYARFLGMGFAKGDELQFVGDVLEELASQEKLPLLTAMAVARWGSELQVEIEKKGDLATSVSGDSLRSLSARAAILSNVLVQKLESLFAEPFDADRMLELKATFASKPAVALADLMNSVAAASTLDTGQAARSVRAEGGSYVEIIYTTLASVMAFRAFLFLLNGCLIQLTELKQRAKVLARRQVPKSYIELALTPMQQSSPIVLSVVHGLARFSQGLPWLNNATLSGYAVSNIKNLEIGESGIAGRDPNSPEI